ncbi:MAG: WD40 repeat domain-containing protein [Microcoleaceae cyanobacterium]
MNLPPYLYPFAAPLLFPIARQLGRHLSTVMNAKPRRHGNEEVPTLTDQVQDDPRMVEALVEYSERRVSRVQEFQSLALTQNERRLQLQRQELHDRQEIDRLQRELVRELQANEIQLKLHELDAIWNQEKWFSNLSRQETDRILIQGQAQSQLLMLMAPPDISEDCPSALRTHLKKDISNGLRRFLAHHYGQTHADRPVEFYADYFTRPLGDIEVRKLQMVLAPVPTFVLYSDINDYQIHLHVGFWGWQYQSVSLMPIQPWDWETAKQRLETQGNTEIQALRQVRQLIVTTYQVVAAFLIDWYYLNEDPNYQPHLFNLTSEFSPTLLKAYIKILKQIQAHRRKARQQEIKLLLKRAKQQHGSQRAESQVPSLTDALLNSLSDPPLSAPKNTDAVPAGTELEDDKTASAPVPTNPQNWQDQLTLTGHSDAVGVLAISPDTQFIISGGWDYTIRTWSVQTGQLQRISRGHTNSITALVVSPDSQFIISGSVDTTVKIWSMRTGELLNTLTGHDYAISALAISPDGKWIASGSWDNNIRIWSAITGDLKNILLGHSNSISAIAITPDGQQVISGSMDHSISVWSLKTGNLERTYEPFQGLRTMGISVSGGLIAGGIWDHTIDLWSLTEKRVLRSLPGETSGIVSLAISPDEQLIASGNTDQTVKIWSVSTGYLLRTLTGHFNEINALSFSPNGTFLVSGSGDGTAKVWRCDSQDESQ